MVPIINKFSQAHTTYSPNRPIQWIVVHYTAGVSSKPGSALNNAAWFRNPQAAASTDFLVDDTAIVQYNGDIKNRFCWSVGGKKYPNMTTSLGGQYYGKCTNKNSISIEMCSNKINKKSLDVYDEDWYLTTATVNNCIDLVRMLMDIYHIDINHVIMHHQVTGKICPQPWVLREEKLQHWRKFLQAVNDGVKVSPSPVTPQPAPAHKAPYKVKVVSYPLNIRSGPSVHTKIVGCIKSKGVYTIIETKNGFGKLKSGAGWIMLRHTKRV